MMKAGRKIVERVRGDKRTFERSERKGELTGCTPED